MRGVVVAFALVGGCGRLAFDVPGAPNAPADMSLEAIVTGPFGVPMQLSELDGPLFEDDVTVSEDLLEIYFTVATSVTAPGDLWRATRASASAPFDPAVAVAELNTAAHEGGPALSPDGLTLLFDSDRAGGQGSYDVWRATRPARGAPWELPAPVAELNSNLADEHAKEVRAGTRVVFTRLGTGLSFDSGELHEAVRPDAGWPWSVPMAMTDLNTTLGELGPLLVDGGLTIYFYSNRPGSSNSDIYRATRAALDQPFAVPELVSELNTTAREEDPWLSADGHVIFFVRNQKIYQATR